MKLGRLLGGLSTASALTLASFCLAPASGAAPTPPASYAAAGARLPAVLGRLRRAIGGGRTAGPVRLRGDQPRRRSPGPRPSSPCPTCPPRPMTGEQIARPDLHGLSEKRCADPFLPEATVGHSSRRPGERRDQAASFGGKDSKWPGHIDALNSCDGDCGNQLVRTLSEAAGARRRAERLHHLGRVAAGPPRRHRRRLRPAHGRCPLRAAGRRHRPEGEVTFSRLTSTATRLRPGVRRTPRTARPDRRRRHGHPRQRRGADPRPVCSCPAGPPSEQEAYDGAKALLESAQGTRDRPRAARLRRPGRPGGRLSDGPGQRPHRPLRPVRPDPAGRPEAIDAGRPPRLVDHAGHGLRPRAEIDVSYEGDDVVVQAQPKASRPRPTQPRHRAAHSSGDDGAPTPRGPAKPGQPVPRAQQRPTWDQGPGARPVTAPGRRR